MYLIHTTDFDTFKRILKSGCFLKKHEVQNNNKYSIPYFFDIEKNLSNDPYKILKKECLTYLDELDATFFKLSLKDNIQDIYTDCMFILKYDILNKHRFVFNTEPNKGFLIAKEGILHKSRLTGRKGISVQTYPYFLKTINNFKFNLERSELAVLDKINIEDVKYIIIKKQYYTEDIVKKCLNYDILTFISN